jgi:hypothetical protein
MMLFSFLQALAVLNWPGARLFLPKPGSLSYTVSQRARKRLKEKLDITEAISLNNVGLLRLWKI